MRLTKTISSRKVSSGIAARLSFIADYNFLNSFGGDSISLSANSAGAVALDSKKSTLRNGDPGGAVRATAPLEFDLACTKYKVRPVRIVSDEFISDNLQDEYAIDIISHKRPVGIMTEAAEWTIGGSSSFSWLRRSSIRAFPSWRAEGLARIIFPLFDTSMKYSLYLIESLLGHLKINRPWGLHYRPQSL